MDDSQNLREIYENQIKLLVAIYESQIENLKTSYEKQQEKQIESYEKIIQDIIKDKNSMIEKLETRIAKLETQLDEWRNQSILSIQQYNFENSQFGGGFSGRDSSGDVSNT